VNALARSLTQPLLVVRDRVRGPYRRIVVATDFSASARLALRTAAAFFPTEALTLYHAFALPMSGSATPGSAQARAAGEVRQSESARFLEESGLTPQALPQIEIIFEAGPVAPSLTKHARLHEVDLVVMGGGRGGLMEVLLGSTAAELLDWLPCDFAARAGIEMRSGRSGSYGLTSADSISGRRSVSGAGA
jgi:nucleotide-binding universal stress UspA family protein